MRVRTGSSGLVPVRLDEASVPVPLQPLAWLTADRTPEGIRQEAQTIADTLHCHDPRPAVDPPSAYTSAPVVTGLTPADSAMLTILIQEAIAVRRVSAAAASLPHHHAGHENPGA